MSLPFFYLPGLVPSASELVLDEAGSRHCVQVLRMQAGEELVLTDGRGARVVAELIRADRRSAVARPRQVETVPFPGASVTIGISPVKNSARFEWFLEKVTELGVRRVIPLICRHTERQQVRPERLGHILVSAMLQSEQVWLPELTDARPLAEMIVAKDGRAGFIAHCRGGEREPLKAVAGAELTVLIGPEGDFSEEEVALARAGGWRPVSLGGNRLRTETAGVAAAVILRIGAEGA